jgi:hypothetical protein
MTSWRVLNELAYDKPERDEFVWDELAYDETLCDEWAPDKLIWCVMSQHITNRDVISWRGTSW